MKIIKESFPLLPVRNTVVFPSTSIFLVIGREKSVAALKESKKSNGKIVIVSQKYNDSSQDEIDVEKLNRTGTLCEVRNVSGSDKTGYQVLVTGLYRFEVESITLQENYLLALGENIPDKVEDSIESTALFNSLKSIAKEVLELLPGTDTTLQSLIDKITRQDEIVYLGASYLKLDVNQMQQLLEEDDIKKKMKILLDWFVREKEVLLLEKDIKDKVGKRFTHAQREAFLREQLKEIKEELGETEEVIGEKFLEKIEKVQMPESVKKVAEEEAARLQTLHPSSADHQVLKNYLDWLCDMPWNVSTDDVIDLDKSEIILEEHHFGLQKIKKRILEHLAINKLIGSLKGPILCLYGPPGVGKTSLGKSIAEALGRKFVRTSLGGIRDESEIRGHRRTYIGSMPGRIIQSIKRVGVNNPLILLDEIDKLGMSYQGDPASAMLEVLDPEQNNTFVDHYLDVPFDLSKVFFVATANRLDTIPAPLKDRMELIELSSYTLDEKVNICREFIIQQTLNENGLKKTDVMIDDNILESLIEQYTREPGVRELKRIMSSLCRGAAFEIVKGVSKPLLVDRAKVEEYLGPPKFMGTQKFRKWTPGLATGLAWTPVGGDVLYLECLAMPGSGKLKLTGQLGDVMKESAEIAISYTRSCLKKLNPKYDMNKNDIHLHVPAGAIPKDGPSAGVAMLTALVSLVLDKKVEENIAMTGEITLSGSVLPVGGIKEKVIAAHRYKIKKVILPKGNEKDLLEIPEEIKKELEFIPVESVDQVLEETLNIYVNNHVNTEKIQK